MKTSLRKSTLVSLLSVIVLTLPSAAHADNASDAAEAETLFKQARQLVEAHQFAEACPKFAKSEKLAPGVGTLLNLADCYAQEGKTASAWTTFQDAAAAAQRAGRADREKVAHDRMEALESKGLSKLTIRLYVPDANVVVKRDGEVIDPAAFGASVPLDPGTHVIEASAPGKKSWSTAIEVQTGVIMTTMIPVLDDAPSAIAPSIASNPTPHRAPSVQKTIGFGAMGVGVVSAAVGAVFGIRAISQWSSVKDDCPGGLCNPEGVSRASDASASGNISTVAFIASGVFVVGGAVLVLTTPSSKTTVGVAPSLGQKNAGLVLNANF